MTEETNGQKPSGQEPSGPETAFDGHFFRLVATFEAAAMQQLGKIAHPLTGEVDVSLEGARDSIDMLGMLKRKCAGNLSDDETRLLEHVLHQLQMNYVDVSAEQDSGTGDGGDSSGAGGAEADGDNGGAEADGDNGGDESDEDVGGAGDS